ncbi:MAG: hypothetical protein FWB90_06985 [Fibromonadales bacterium]|nr:hypothetical protein [Fibromonadales bacterium]
MNKKLLLSFIAVFFTIILLACGDSIVETTGNGPIETTARLTIMVQDGLAGTPLAGASVTFISTGELGVEVAPGTFVFEKVYVGNHNLLVSNGATHAERIYGTSIVGKLSENVYIAQENAETVPLNPLSSGLEGYIYYTNKDNVNVPAEEVTVYLQFASDNLVKKIYPATGVTGPDGKYVFTGLPAVGEPYTIVAIGKTLGSIPFQTMTFGPWTDLARGVVVDKGIRTITQAQNTAVFAVSQYSEVIAADKRDTTVFFVFSDKVDASKLTISSIGLPSSEVADIKWNADYDTLNITPISMWSAREGSFNVNLSALRSVRGASLPTQSYTIIVNKEDLSALEVTGLKVIGVDAKAAKKDSVDYGSSSVNLIWNKVDGAEGYKIYRRLDGQNSYTDMGITISNVLDTMRSNVGFGSPIANRKAKFLVQAVNSQSRSRLDTLNALEVQDNVGPTAGTQVPGDIVARFDSYTPDEIASIFYLNYYLSQTAESPDIHEACILFDEPIDATEATFGFVNAGGDASVVGRLEMAKIWRSNVYENDELCLTFKVGAGQAITPGLNLNAIYSIKGLKDKSPMANPFVKTYTNLHIPVVTTNNLEFRFITTM